MSLLPQLLLLWSIWFLLGAAAAIFIVGGIIAFSWKKLPGKLRFLSSCFLSLGTLSGVLYLMFVDQLREGFPAWNMPEPFNWMEVVMGGIGFLLVISWIEKKESWLRQTAKEAA